VSVLVDKKREGQVIKVMLHKISLVVILTMTSLGTFAREITGFVKDRKNQEPIPFSNIWHFYWRYQIFQFFPYP
jgi:hypothetical protein